MCGESALSLVSRRSRNATVAALTLAALGCNGGTEPSTSPFDLRRDPRDLATISGRVLAAPVRGVPYAQWPKVFDRPLVGITVELGRWEGRSLVGVNEPPPASSGTPGVFLGQPYVSRVTLRIMAKTRTDRHGHYEFRGVPREGAVSVQVESSYLDENTFRMGRYIAARAQDWLWLAKLPDPSVDLYVWDQEQ
jgi:hypothetical protein